MSRPSPATLAVMSSASIPRRSLSNQAYRQPSSISPQGSFSPAGYRGAPSPPFPLSPPLSPPCWLDNRPQAGASLARRRIPSVETPNPYAPTTPSRLGSQRSSTIGSIASARRRRAYWTIDSPKGSPVVGGQLQLCFQPTLPEVDERSIAEGRTALGIDSDPEALSFEDGLAKAAAEAAEARRVYSADWMEEHLRRTEQYPMIRDDIWPEHETELGLSDRLRCWRRDARRSLSSGWFHVTRHARRWLGLDRDGDGMRSEMSNAFEVMREGARPKSPALPEQTLRDIRSFMANGRSTATEPEPPKPPGTRLRLDMPSMSDRGIVRDTNSYNRSTSSLKPIVPRRRPPPVSTDSRVTSSAEALSPVMTSTDSPGVPRPSVNAQRLDNVSKQLRRRPVASSNRQSPPHSTAFPPGSVEWRPPIPSGSPSTFSGTNTKGLPRQETGITPSQRPRLFLDTSQRSRAKSDGAGTDRPEPHHYASTEFVPKTARSECSDGRSSVGSRKLQKRRSHSPRGSTTSQTSQPEADAGIHRQDTELSTASSRSRGFRELARSVFGSKRRFSHSEVDFSSPDVLGGPESAKSAKSGLLDRFRKNSGSVSSASTAQSSVFSIDHVGATPTSSVSGSLRSARSVVSRALSTKSGGTRKLVKRRPPDLTSTAA